MTVRVRVTCKCRLNSIQLELEGVMFLNVFPAQVMLLLMEWEPAPEAQFAGRVQAVLAAGEAAKGRRKTVNS